MLERTSHTLPYGCRITEIAVLLEERYARAGRPHDNASRRFERPRDEVEQGRLSGPVPADDAPLFSGRDRERHVTQDRAVAELHRDVR